MLRTTAAVLSTSGLLLASSGPLGSPVPPPTDHTPWPAGVTHASAIGEAFTESDDEVIQRFCVRCHSDRRLRGNLSLEAYQTGNAVTDAALTEKIIGKLRAGMMPPSGARRPEDGVLDALVERLETAVDEAAAENPNPGSRSFQRLNRAEYARAVYTLLGVEIDPSAYLPGETVSGGFDNIADVQNLSPTLLDAYLNAAGEITSLALGNADATPSEATYRVSRYSSQRERVEGAPFGTRGGLAVTHQFPADGEYWFRMSFQHESTGNFFGQTAPFPEQIEIAIDGVRQVVMDIDPWMHMSDPKGVTMQTPPVAITAGPHTVSVAFVKNTEGPLEDLMSPHEWSLADKKIGYSYGITSLPHLRDVAIGGPFNVTGVSDNPIRDRVLFCRPSASRTADECAEEILTHFAERAYRRTLNDADVSALLALYKAGEEDGGFEGGIRTGLHGVLAGPDFVFRFEEPTSVDGDGLYRLSDEDLATRLSFFLWGQGPDAELLETARSEGFTDDGVLQREVSRMLADPRSESLGTRFAAQWLRLQDLEKVHPDAIWFPDFHQQLSDAMRRETELFFHHLVAEDRSFLDLFTADYTFVNERLARHYGISGVAGDRFVRAEYPDNERRGILGHGSVLVSTSHANRTSPVLRGKWIMEVLLGSPPPPPPPDVPDLDATEETVDGRNLTVRERMEMHRANPSCNSCHNVIDPLGLALEHFDVTGAYRIRDSGMPVDTRGELYDGTSIETPEDLRRALLSRPEPLVRTFVGNLMAYALGRRVEYYDMPTVRRISREAASQDYRMSAFIMGVVTSDAFRTSRWSSVTDGAPLY